MNVAHATEQNEKFSNLNVPVSGFYLLAAPSTPAEVIEVAAERSDSGIIRSRAQANRAFCPVIFPFVRDTRGNRRPQAQRQGVSIYQIAIWAAPYFNAL